MSRTPKLIYFLVTLSMTLIPLCQSSIGCQVDAFYLTKEGYLAAPTQERLREAGTCEKEQKNEKLDALIKNKLVMRLKDSVKVQALERSFEMKMIKIKLEDSSDSYWVNDGALKQIKCDPQ